MVKTINMHKDSDKHEFGGVADAIAFFAQDHKVRITGTREVVDGLTKGKDTMVKRQTIIGLFDTDPGPESIYADVPDEVIIIEDQALRSHPL